MVGRVVNRDCVDHLADYRITSMFCPVYLK